MDKLNKAANWISQSYWLIAISILKDIIEVVIGIFKFGFDFNMISVDWIDLITKAVLAFAVVQIFRQHNKTKNEIEKIKKEYQHQKKRLEDLNYIATLVNLVRLETMVTSKMQFTAEIYKLEHLQTILEKEKDWIKRNLLHLQKHRTVEEIECMIEDFYKVNFLLPNDVEELK